MSRHHRHHPQELLAARHLVTGFCCRSEEQTARLVEKSKQAHGMAPGDA
ncbi:MAG: hypothetical protein RLZZ117_217 [Cyanobacteriota bacterium]